MEHDERTARFAASRERIVRELLQASEGSPMHQQAVDSLVRDTAVCISCNTVPARFMGLFTPTHPELWSNTTPAGSSEKRTFIYGPCERCTDRYGHSGVLKMIVRGKLEAAMLQARPANEVLH